MDTAFKTIEELTAGLEQRVFTSVELTEFSLTRIAELDSVLHAFVRTTEKRAFREAEASDARRARGEIRGPLDGIPYAVKDIFDVEGEPTMCGLSFLEKNIASSDSTAVERLARAGMVLIGKTHTHQLACYITGVNPDQGTPHNPWSEEHLIPGGSSSGSAVAVAAGMVPVALGSDTAGSIRVPAALCGIVGLKPTGGLVGRGGVHPLSWSLDTVGVMTRGARDAALVFEPLIGLDDRDETTRGRLEPPILQDLERGVVGLRIAICETLYLDDCDAEAVQAMERAAALLADLGAEITRRPIPGIASAREEPHRDVILGAEAYAVNKDLLENHPEVLEPIAQYMLEGRTFSAFDYYHALRGRQELQARVAEQLASIDAFLAPTTVAPAWPVEKVASGDMPKAGYTRNTDAVNTLDLASISVPVGTTTDGLPLGMTINAPSFHDATTLRIGRSLLGAAPDLLRTPDLSWASRASAE